MDVPQTVECGLAPFGIALNDTSVAVVAAIACFALPDGLATWVNVPSGCSIRTTSSGCRDILLLFGRLALAKGFEAAGWAGLLADGAAGLGWSQGAMLVLVTGIGLFATELMSNLALTLLLTPVAGILAVGMGVHPLYFAAPVVFASVAPSCSRWPPRPTRSSFLGPVRMADMARIGLLLNLVTLGAILLLWVWLAPEAWR